MTKAIVERDEPIDDYHSDKNWISRSQLWDLKECGPQLFYTRHILGHGKAKKNDGMERGQIIHDWLEGVNWRENVMVIPDSALSGTGRRVKATDEWEAEQLKERPGLRFLKAGEIESIEEQIAGIKANPMFASLHGSTVEKELSIRWRGPNDLPLKVRPDCMTSDGCLWDMKTTGEQFPLLTFGDSVGKYGYGLQAVMYLAGARAAGYDVHRFVFLVSSTQYPYLCHAVELEEDDIAWSLELFDSLTREVSNRIELDYWLPSDYGQITKVSVPPWHKKGRKNNGRSKSIYRIS